MPIMLPLPHGVEVVPRLWLGDNTSCDYARPTMSFTCINVGSTPHTTDPACNFIPILPVAGAKVDNSQLQKVMALLVNSFPTSNLALLHCQNGLTASALATALWLQMRYNITLTQVYQWVLTKQPLAQVLTGLLPPHAPDPVAGSVPQH